jgi:hypothetical protein
MLRIISTNKKSSKQSLEVFNTKNFGIVDSTITYRKLSKRFYIYNYNKGVTQQILDF